MTTTLGGLQQEKGKFPTQPQVNPLVQHSVDTSMVLDSHLEHLKSITTLRNDKQIEKTIYPNPVCNEAYKSSTESFKELEPSSSESESVSKNREKKKCFVKFRPHFLKDSECQRLGQRMLKFTSSSSK